MGQPKQVDMSVEYTRNTGRRRTIGALLVAAMLLISIGGFSYVSFQREALTTVVYEINGYTMEIGVTWLFNEFRGMEPPDNIMLGIGIIGDISEGTGGSVRYNFEHRRMNLEEYHQLNETEHDSMFASGESGEYGLPGTAFGGGGLSGPIHDYTYVFALRFLEVGGQTEGSISVSIQIYIRPF